MASLTLVQQAIRDSQSRAKNDFSSMDGYSRWCIYTGGTAFTTYEDAGPTYCKELERLVREWFTEMKLTAPILGEILKEVQSGKVI